MTTPSEPYATHCPDPGRADPGYLCIYPHEMFNLTPNGNSWDPADGLEGPNKDGAMFSFTVNGPGESYVNGVWAATAP